MRTCSGDGRVTKPALGSRLKRRSRSRIPRDSKCALPAGVVLGSDAGASRWPVHWMRLRPQPPSSLGCEAEAQAAGSWPVGELVRVIVEAPWPGQLRFRRSSTSSTRCARWGLSTKFDRFLPVGLGLGSWENQGFQFRVRQSGLTAMNNRRGVTGHVSDDGKRYPRTLDNTPPNRRTITTGQTTNEADRDRRAYALARQYLLELPDVTPELLAQYQEPPPGPSTDVPGLDFRPQARSKQGSFPPARLAARLLRYY
jgi:hypothetical protein